MVRRGAVGIVMVLFSALLAPPVVAQEEQTTWSTGYVFGTSVLGSSATITEFRQSCEVPLSQGVDAHIFDLGAPVAGGPWEFLTVSESSVWGDIDVTLFDDSCTFLDAFAEAGDETGPLPTGTRYVAAMQWMGADTQVRLGIRPAAATPSPTAPATPSPTPSPTSTSRETEERTFNFFLHGKSPNNPLFLADTFDEYAPSRVVPAGSTDIPFLAGPNGDTTWVGQLPGVVKELELKLWHVGGVSPTNGTIRYWVELLPVRTNERFPIGVVDVPVSDEPTMFTATFSDLSIPANGEYFDLHLRMDPFVQNDADVLLIDSINYPSGFSVVAEVDKTPEPEVSPTASPSTSPTPEPAPSSVAYRAATRGEDTELVEYDGPPLDLRVNDVGTDAFEPTVGIDNEGRAFYPAQPLGDLDILTYRTDILRSDDDGESWRSVSPEVELVGRMPPMTFDPYIYVDEDTDRVFSIDMYPTVLCAYIVYSDDAGANWEHNPAACGQFVTDHMTVVTGPPPPGVRTIGYPNVVYYCFNRVIDSNCSRSLDGGRTFHPAGTPAFLGVDPNKQPTTGDPLRGFCGGLHGHIVTDSEGRLFLPKGQCREPWLAISEDAGITWDRVKVSDISAADTHLSVAVDSADNLYFVWWDREENLPYLATSSDHGQTWSEPVMIAPPGVEDVNLPVIDAGDPGRVVVNFLGTTSDDSDDPMRPWNQYLVVSTNALDAEPTFVSTTTNSPPDPMHRGDCSGRCGNLLDFMDVTISPSDGTFWATGVDDCTELRGCNAGLSSIGGSLGMVFKQLGGPTLWDVDSRLAFASDSATAGRYSDETTIGARLTTDTGVPLGGHEVEFAFEGTEATWEATTDDEGRASIQVPLTLRPGVYELRASFEGQGPRRPATATTVFVVQKETTSLALTSEGRGARRVLVAHLVDGDSGAPVPGRTISFRADGAFIGTGVTDSDGRVVFDLPPRYHGGPHRFEASYDGSADDYYSGASAWVES